MLGLMAPAAALDSPRRPSRRRRQNNTGSIPGDELEIYVWGEERLQRTVKVLPDGTIAFPLVGQMVAQGLLPRELEVAISGRLQGQYRGEVPQVTVSVVAPSGMQFSVMGRVKAPGTFTPGRYVTVLEALSMAGGPNEFANLDNVLVIRKEGDRIRAFRLRLGAVFRAETTWMNRGRSPASPRFSPATR
jgi:polysaccharide export outer membrane protein